MTAPTVEAAINDRMDRAGNVVYKLLAVLFADTRPVDAIPFHHDLLGADDPKSFFEVSR
jgi:hypothetical protein